MFMKEGNMKKVKNNRELAMQKHYDLSNSKSNRFYKKYQEGSNIVLIDEDLIEYFPSEKKVNEGLRFLVEMLDLMKTKTHLIKAKKVYQKAL